MKFVYLLSSALLAAVPALASAQDVLQPKYPPGMDCAQVPAGSQREACGKSQLDPTIDTDLNKDRSTTSGPLQTPGTVSPPTVPNEPGSENRDTGSGSNDGTGVLGN
ncbi:MAG TPA: hypothetical protein VGQ35_11975 [Dongiaceae bacterium]|nr:hypothetical protein [Dongiaceae bacterium]